MFASLFGRSLLFTLSSLQVQPLMAAPDDPGNFLRVEDRAARLLPPQTPPIAAASVTFTDLGVVNNLHKAADDTRPVRPSSLHFDLTGAAYVQSSSTEENVRLEGGPSRGLDFYHHVLVRHGANSWRREREFAVLEGQKLERWFPGGPYAPIDIWEQERESGGSVVFDGAGNSFHTFTLFQRETRDYNDGGFTREYLGWGLSPEIIVAKFNPSGDLLWRVGVPGGPTTQANWRADSTVVDIRPLSNGGAALLIRNFDTAKTNVTLSSYSEVVSPQTIVATVNNGSIQYIRIFGNDDPITHERYNSDPERLAVDSLNRVFTLSRETLSDVIRRFEPDGTMSAEYRTNSTIVPQTITGMETDSAGDVYLSSIFAIGAGDQRQCLTKLSNSLIFQWRAFGPKNSSGGGQVQLNVGPVGITLSSTTSADPGALYPFAHPVISRFTNNGMLTWSRGFQSTHATSAFGDFIENVKVAFDGSILFTASLGGSGGSHYGKMSNAGDIQFLRPVNGLLIDGALKPDGDFAMLIQEGIFPNIEPFRIVGLGNPQPVMLPTVFDPQPLDVVANVGAPVVLTAINRGSQADYQWQKLNGERNFADVTGATTETLTFDPSVASDSGSYRLEATNNTGTFYSRTSVVFIRNPISLGDALEQPSLTWTTGGVSPWRGVAPGPSFDGIDAAECGPQDGNGTSWIRTTVQGPATLRFHWKVSSLEFQNTLSLWIDGTHRESTSGEHDWAQKDFTLAAGSHEIEWRYNKTFPSQEDSNQAWIDNVRLITATNPPSLNPSYPEDKSIEAGTEAVLFSFNLGDVATFQWYKLSSQGVPIEIAGETNSVLSIPSFEEADAGRYVVYATNSAGTRVSRTATITFLPLGTDPVPLAESLDDAGRTWTTGGTDDIVWSGLANAAAKDGIDQAQSGTILGNGNTWLETTVQGPGTVKFWWRTSSEVNYDFLTFTLNGSSPNKISGELQWAERTVSIPAGSHLLRWTYSKDSFSELGSDRAYVDQFSFVGSGSPSGYNTWAGGQGFTAAELLDPLISGPLADPDRDGIANLLEYVFGLSARTPNSQGALIVPRRITGEFSVGFTRQKALSGVVVGAESWNGQTGSAWTSAGVTLTKESETATTETWRASLSTTADKGFMRVIATPTQ